MTEPSLLDRLGWLAERLDGLPSTAEAHDVREAIRELEERRLAEAEESVVEGSAEPEVYVYRLIWWVERADGIYLPDSSRLERSTPILTCEDVRVIEREISRDHGARVKGLHHILMKG